MAQANLGGEQARGQKLRQRSHVADATGENHGHAIAGHFHVGQDVGRVEHRAAFATKFEHEVSDLLAADRIEPGHRLVEHDQLGIAHQRLRDADALEHALGKLTQRPAARVIEPHAPDESVGAKAPLAPGHIEKGTHEIEKLLGREIFVKIGTLGQIAEAALGLAIGNRSSQHLGAAARRKHQAHEHFEGGGFARAVGAEVTEHLAAPDVEGGFLDRFDSLAEKSKMKRLGQSVGA